MRKKKIPKSFQGILWSADVKDLELEKDRVYIIHQILMFGNFKEIKWLFRNYSLKEIVDVFVNCPQKIYTKDSFYFVKNFLLPLEKSKIKDEKYVTSFFGKTRQRTPKGFLGA